MNKKRYKRKIKKQLIFNCISIIVICVFGIYYLVRLIHFKIENDKEINYSNILATQIVERIDKYDIDNKLTLTNNIYRFINDADNNYVRFMGYTWRIIRINEDKSITMITDDSIISLAYGNIEDFTTSQINNWLNVNKNEDNTGIFYNTIKDNEDYLTYNKTCLDTFNDIETIGCYEATNNYKISLLSVKDYALAGGDNSFLNNGSYFWTSNDNDNNQFWYISSDGKTGVANTDTEYGIRPVITLKSGLKVLGGVGTSDDPYIIEKHEVKTLKDTYVGEYIILNDSLWRIVSKGNRTIKVVSEDYIKDAEGKIYEENYSDINNLSHLDDKTSILYYLNHTYYDNFKEKNLLIKGPYYNGEYDRNGNYNYTSTYKSKVNAYVGLLSIAEPFIYDVGNTFTISRNIDNELSIFVINEDKMLFEDVISTKMSVRPAVYVNYDANVISGTGTYLDPYKVGSDIDETKEEK